MKSKRPLIRTIGIALKENDLHATRLLKRFSNLFLGFRDHYQFVLENHIPKEIAKSLPKGLFKLMSFSSLLDSSDLVLSIGGDGTILRCARSLLASNRWAKTKLLGINAGHMGFLTFINPQEADSSLALTLKYPNKARIEERSCIEVKIERSGKILKKFQALNDCVLSKGSLSRIFEFHVEVDREFLSSYRSDGLIVSTPTGSTAYNLAAGGSILEHTIPALQLTPVCAQSLTAKPIVVSNKRQIVLSLGRHSTEVYLTIDGHTGAKIQSKDRIHISKSDRCVQFLVPPNLSSLHYFPSLRQKLKWGTSLVFKGPA